MNSEKWIEGNLLEFYLKSLVPIRSPIPISYSLNSNKLHKNESGQSKSNKPKVRAFWKLVQKGKWSVIKEISEKVIVSWKSYE